MTILWQSETYTGSICVASGKGDMSDASNRNRRLAELRAYSELLIYYMLSENPDLGAADRRDSASAARDIVLDHRRLREADEIVREAFRAARAHAKRTGESVQRWPRACPWGVVALLNEAQRRITLWA